MRQSGRGDWSLLDWQEEDLGGGQISSYLFPPNLIAVKMSHSYQFAGCLVYDSLIFYHMFLLLLTCCWNCTEIRAVSKFFPTGVAQLLHWCLFTHKCIYIWPFLPTNYYCAIKYSCVRFFKLDVQLSIYIFNVSRPSIHIWGHNISASQTHDTTVFKTSATFKDTSHVMFSYHNITHVSEVINNGTYS